MQAVSVALLFAIAAPLPTKAVACAPSPNGNQEQKSPEEEAKAALKDSDLVFLGHLVSITQASSTNKNSNRVANFQVKNVLRGDSQASLQFLQSACGSPFLAGPRANSREALVVLAKEGQLLKAYPEASMQGRTVRLAFVPLIGQAPPASQSGASK